MRPCGGYVSLPNTALAFDCVLHVAVNVSDLIGGFPEATAVDMPRIVLGTGGFEGLSGKVGRAGSLDISGLNQMCRFACFF